MRNIFDFKELNYNDIIKVVGLSFFFGCIEVKIDNYLGYCVL